jgi:hypothetical protein
VSAGNGEAPIAAGLLGTGETEHAYSATEQTSCLEKLKATLRARLALAGGYVLLELSDGSFVVSRWNLSRPLADLYAVSRFVDQVNA